MSKQSNQAGDSLALLIYRVVSDYVRVKAEQKSKLNVSNFDKDEEGRRIYPSEFLSAREKVAMDAFLAIRSRNTDEFIEYFTGSIFAMPQHLKEKEYLELGQTLANADQCNNIKNLTMLALSARAWHYNANSLTSQ